MKSILQVRIASLARKAFDVARRFVALAMSVLRLRSVVTLPPIPNVGSRSKPCPGSAGPFGPPPDVPVIDGLTW